MKSQVDRYDNKKIYILLFLLFILMSVINIIWLWHFHLVYYSCDTAFHLARMTEAKVALLHGHLAEFTQCTTLPYGQATMIYYPWLTLLPYELLVSWLRPVNQYYVLFILIYLTGYLISFFSYKTYSKKNSHCFTFAVLYMNSSIFFNWETDFGTSLAYVLLPLSIFGFIALVKKHHWIMLTLGTSLIIYTHVLDGVILVALLISLGILNINKLKLKGSLKAILAGLSTIVLTSLFWYPALVLSLSNKIQKPTLPLALTKGLLPEVGSTVNYCYGFIDIIGLLTILCCKRYHFTWTDFTLWLGGFFCLIINIKWVCHLVVDIIPQITVLQFVYRMSVEGNILFLILAMNWLFGRYNSYNLHSLHLARHNALIVVLILCYLINPLWNTVNHHFLLQSRPTMTAKTAKKLCYASNNFDQQSNASSSGLYKEERIFYNLDYAPNKRMQNNKYDLQQNILPLIKSNGQFIKTTYFKNDNGTVIFSNDAHGGAQLPFVLYHGVDYQYRLNGHIIPKQDINKKLSDKTDELSLKHLPYGKDEVKMTKSNIKMLSPYSVYRRVLGEGAVK